MPNIGNLVKNPRFRRPEFQGWTWYYYFTEWTQHQMYFLILISILKDWNMLQLLLKKVLRAVYGG